MESQPPAPGNLTQNFFIVLPNTGTVTDVTAGAQAETVMHAIRSALGAAPVPQVQPIGRRATLEDVAREWYQNKVGGWAPSYAGRLRNRLETGLLAHLGTRQIKDMIRKHLATVGATRWKAVRLQCPDISEATFWRYVKAAREELEKEAVPEEAPAKSEKHQPDDGVPRLGALPAFYNPLEKASA